MSFRGGEFSTGTTGNFQPELTIQAIRPLCLNFWLQQSTSSV